MSNKILKKIINIFGYKLVEKNFIKNQRILMQKSDLTVDKVLEYLFKKKYIKHIVQLGANDGISYDHINYFIKKYKIKSLLVEPIKKSFLLLEKNYRNLNYVNLENSAITTNNEIKHLYKVNEKYLKQYDKVASAISSFNFQHLLKFGVKKKHILKEIVNQISLFDLFKKYKIKNFDLLYMDTEGYDCHIVNNFIKKSRIRPIIIFEWVHAPNDALAESLKLLDTNNYFILPVDQDLFCIPKQKNIKLLLN
jgi:FkbM family methyltransferase